jgi:hypothetical protein
VRSSEDMEVNDFGEPCAGRTALKILRESIEKFPSQQDVINLIKSDRCSDGEIKTTAMCERGWRGEICVLCPLHGT